MSKMGKYLRKSFFVDSDLLKCRTKHRPGIKSGYKYSHTDYAVDKRSYLFNNDWAFVSDDNDNEVYFGINKNNWSFDGDFDDFKGTFSIPEEDTD